MSRVKKQYGIAVVVVTVLAVSSITAYQKINAATAPQQISTQPVSVTQDDSVYSNAKYGFSFSYPKGWAPSADVTNDPKTSATRQEFGTGLKLNTDGEYSNTVDFEVLDEPLQTAQDWYDQYFAQSTIKVSKTTDDLKGKQSVQYHFVAPTYETKLYLFAVGSKTYLFSSINESLNTSASDSYWIDFDNSFNSLTITQ